MIDKHTLLLKDYGGERFFSFDRTTGSVGATARTSGAQGFGQWRTLGLRRARERTFVAVFLDGDEIVMSLAGGEHQLTQPGFAASISRRALGFAREFRLSCQGEARFAATYWWPFGEGGWPDDGDIFSLVLRVANANDGGRGFVRVWQAHSEGQDLSSTEFLEQLDALNDQRRTDPN